MPKTKLRLYMEIPEGHACINPDCEYGCLTGWYSQEEYKDAVIDAEHKGISETNFDRDKETDKLLEDIKKELKAQFKELAMTPDFVRMELLFRENLKDEYDTELSNEYMKEILLENIDSVFDKHLKELKDVQG